MGSVNLVVLCNQVRDTVLCLRKGKSMREMRRRSIAILERRSGHTYTAFAEYDRL